MPKNVTDGFDTYTAGQEPHRKRVSEAVGTTAERWQARLSRSLLQDVTDSESLHRTVRAACAVKQCRMVDRPPCLIMFQIAPKHAKRGMREGQDEF